MKEWVKIGLVSISDRASTGIYVDQGLPELENWLKKVIKNPCHFIKRLIPDKQSLIEETLCDLVDSCYCDLVFTTGGTGPALRDVTPEATLAIADRVIPGFGEQMRQISLAFVPTAMLSRQVGVIRKKALILNLPGQPKTIKETLEGIKGSDDAISKTGLFASIPYCIQLLGGPYIETQETLMVAFRPDQAKPAMPIKC